MLPTFFRIFDLSSALAQPEQEYYLQPVEHGSSCDAASICPVDFSFGGDHLWDKFSVSLFGTCIIFCLILYLMVVLQYCSKLRDLSNSCRAAGFIDVTLFIYFWL